MTSEGKLLLDVSDEDILEFGCPFPTITKDSMAWRVEESCIDPEDSSKKRILLKGYIFNTFFIKLIARVDLEKPHKVAWYPSATGPLADQPKVTNKGV